MKQSTHIAVATAINLAVFHPIDLNNFTLLIAASSIGGIISDIDVTTSESHKDLEKIIIISFIAIVLCSISEVYFNIGILKNIGIVLYCISIILAYASFFDYFKNFKDVLKKGAE